MALIVWWQIFCLLTWKGVVASTVKYIVLCLGKQYCVNYTQLFYQACLLFIGESKHFHSCINNPFLDSILLSPPCTYSMDVDFDIYTPCCIMFPITFQTKHYGWLLLCPLHVPCHNIIYILIYV